MSLLTSNTALSPSADTFSTQLTDLTGTLNTNPTGAAAAYSAAYQNRVVAAPMGVLQIGAFAFDYLGPAEVNTTSEATDHWLESNTASQDHVGVKPVIVTLRGYISELTLQASVAAAINAAIGTVENTLTQADAYLGSYTPGTTNAILNAITQVQNVAYQIEQVAARAGQIASFFLPGPAMNQQQAAFAQLSALWAARILFTVYTPFQVFNNMLIIDLKAIQSEKTVTMSDFHVTMKQIQLTDDLSAASFQANAGGNYQYSSQPQTSNGITAGTPSSFSTLVSAF